MNTKSPTPALVHMTGPHPSRASRGGVEHRVWQVAVVASADRKPTSTVYRCLSYRRAVSLSCKMAQDRKLFLHLEALPR